jgi:hypothetical protein
MRRSHCALSQKSRRTLSLMATRCTPQGRSASVPFVTTVGPFDLPAAQWARRRAGTRGQGQGDRRRGGLKAPGFEPDRAWIRQQARE